jgi:hypothetical protein
MSVRLYLVIVGIILFVGIEGKPVVSGKLSERINHLLDITQAEQKFNSVLDAFVTNDPNLSLYKTQVLSFINKFVSFKSLRPHIVEIYGDLYTLADINGIIKFYSSPLGKKMVDKEGKADVRLVQLVKTQLDKQMPQIASWFQQQLSADVSNDQVNKAIKSIH